MRGINRVFLFGHLGHNPELRHTPAGTSVTELRMATNRRTKSGDEWVDRTDWHRVTVWGKDADNACRFLVKGSPLAIEGRLTTDTWEDRKSGDKRSKTYVVAERVHFVGSPRQAAAPRGDTPGMDPSSTSPQPEFSQDDIPF